MPLDGTPAQDGQAERAGQHFGLTDREVEVLALLAEGMPNREVGERLFISEKTASVHVSRNLAKLDVRRRVEVATLAQRAGLVPLPRSRSHGAQQAQPDVLVNVNWALLWRDSLLEPGRDASPLYLWSLLDSPRSSVELAQNLTLEFETAAGRAHSDVEVFLAALRDIGAVRQVTDGQAE